MGAKGTSPLADAATSVDVEMPGAGRDGKQSLLLGQQGRTLDDRGRLSLPTKFRWAFAQGAIVLPWPGPCIAVMPVERFVKIERKMRAKERAVLGDAMARDALTELATHIPLDAQGRLFLDAELRSEVGIDHELLVIGRVRHLELWAPGSRDDGRTKRMQALHAHIAAEAL